MLILIFTTQEYSLCVRLCKLCAHLYAHMCLFGVSMSGFGHWVSPSVYSNVCSLCAQPRVCMHVCVAILMSVRLSFTSLAAAAWIPRLHCRLIATLSMCAHVSMWKLLHSCKYMSDSVSVSKSLCPYDNGCILTHSPTHGYLRRCAGFTSLGANMFMCVHSSVDMHVPICVLCFFQTIRSLFLYAYVCGMPVWIQICRCNCTSICVHICEST